MDNETDFVGDVFKIAFGVALGGLLLWAAFEYRARYELAHAAAAVAEMSQAPEASRLQAARQRSDAQRMQRLEAAAKARELSDRRQVALMEQRRKLAAWEKFYQPAPGCLVAASVDCGNAHIRARREFDRRYAAGEF